MNDLIARINDAPLSAPAYRTARRLLDRARNGVTHLTHEELRIVVGGEDGTARNHLHQLHSAGLIVYRRNAAVTIWWQENGAEIGEIAAETDPETVVDADRCARSACKLHAERENCTPSARNDQDGCTLSVKIARPACKLHAQRAQNFDADYITRSSTIVDDDDDNYNRSSSSSSSSPTPNVDAPQPLTAPQPAPQPTAPPQPQSQPPAGYATIASVYEQNIGLITPIMAGTLKTALAIYPLEWIEQAIGLAVRNERRRWSYVEGILTNWKIEGFNGNQGKSSNMAAAGGDAGRRAQPDRRTAQTGRTQQLQYGSEWDIDFDAPPAVDEVA